ncbi:MAG: zinc metallopeptidase [Pseudomonadales bacterium]|nr:zinc metallopeptidase [Pseudomonadales bacterium]
MIFIAAAVLLLAGIFGPSVWVQYTLRKYATPSDRYTGTGGELARELLDRCGLAEVSVEISDHTDHYDPLAKSVRLAKANLEGRSLTALTVAAHEVGHATQDRDAYAPLRLRTQMAILTIPAQKIGAAMLMFSPILALITRTPLAGGLMLLGGFLSLGTETLVHMITLPTEMNASFSRAMPMLDKGNYLRRSDIPHARRILRACAWTYIAASLVSLLNIGRWWAILRR